MKSKVYKNVKSFFVKASLLHNFATNFSNTFTAVLSMRLWFLDTRTSLNRDDGTVWWLSNAQEGLVSHYTMCCCWLDTLCLLKKNLSLRYVLLVCYALLSNAQEELVSHRCFGIRTQSASGEDDEAFLVGLITMLFTRQDTISI